jgi:hypothetical protein
LGVSRVMARKPEQAEQSTKNFLESLRTYATLLGEERAEKEVKKIRERLSDLYASPAAAKQSVSSAFQAQRGSKNFDGK